MVYNLFGENVTWALCEDWSAITFDVFLLTNSPHQFLQNDRFYRVQRWWMRIRKTRKNHSNNLLSQKNLMNFVENFFCSSTIDPWLSNSISAVHFCKQHVCLLNQFCTYMQIKYWECLIKKKTGDKYYQNLSSNLSLLAFFCLNFLSISFIVWLLLLGSLINTNNEFFVFLVIIRTFFSFLLPSQFS